MSGRDGTVDWHAYVDAAAAAHRLPLDPQRREEVVTQMQRIATLARLLDEFPLELHEEPAPVYTPR